MINAALVLRHGVSACEFSNSSWEFVTYMCLCCLRNPTDAGAWLTHTVLQFSLVSELEERTSWSNKKGITTSLFFFFLLCMVLAFFILPFLPVAQEIRRCQRNSTFFVVFFCRCFLHFFVFSVCCVYSCSFLRFKKMSCLSNEELPRAFTSCVVSQSLKNGH